MTSIKDLNTYGKELEDLVVLRTSPLAIKMLKSEDEIPEGTIRPKRDRNHHLAQCQAFTISRRQGDTIAMLKEDNWCWGALFAYGLIDPKIADHYPALINDMKVIPLFEYGKYIGVLSAPLKSATFEPDMVMIYANAGQLRFMLHVMSFVGEGNVDAKIYPVASCALAVVPAMDGEYCVTLPDPGEYGRALATEDEIIYTVPINKMDTLMAQIHDFEDRRMGYRHDAFVEYATDFVRPQFYKDLFKECGLDADDIPTWPIR